MMRLIISAALIFGMGSLATAGELDNESGVTNKELQGTIVLRVNTVTNETSFVKTEAAMSSEADAKAFAQAAEFAKVPEAKMKSELDHDGGASSWYFYSPYSQYNYNYYQPSCNWYGNSYNPYYQYNYGYYNYYYYGSCWSYCR
ncbi:MAG TPA: hypothetical protein VIG33_00010 [Pseudobdellovibrionaceae bacterium]|jgi:hypothetical protein